jgi:hypothetical protein
MPSPLDSLIPPQVKNDGFYNAIVKVAATPGVRTILEIGASSGGGSTEALVNGALKNPGGPPQIHSIEVSKARIGQFQERWKDYPFVHAYNTSSVETSSFPTAETVARFHREVRSKLRNVKLEKALGWLQADLEYLRHHPDLDAPGIARIRETSGIDVFDAALIDGSEFTGEAELPLVYGARFIMLDDTRSYKNWNNQKKLDADPHYKCIKRSRWTRNGWAVFEKTS